MGACYHADITFSDPVFPLLRGGEAGAMWAMLCKQADADMKITLLDAQADDQGGWANWRAEYRFSRTGRPVVNNIRALYAFREGKIVRHVDRFSFWRWASQALGPVGTMLGWFPLLKSKVRKTARDALEKFMSAQAAS